MRQGLSAGFLCLLLIVTLTGCSAQNLKARWHLYKAEQIFWKAHYKLKAQKIPFENRQKFYRESCDYYLKAMQEAPEIFNAGKIEEAEQSCLSAEDQDSSAQFQIVYGAYCAEHPKECEYGLMPSPDWAEF